MLVKLVKKLRGRNPARTVGYRKVSRSTLTDAADTLVAFDKRIEELEALVKTAYEEGWGHGFCVAEAWAKGREPEAWNWDASNARQHLACPPPAASEPLLNRAGPATELDGTDRSFAI